MTGFDARDTPPVGHTDLPPLQAVLARHGTTP